MCLRIKHGADLFAYQAFNFEEIHKEQNLKSATIHRKSRPFHFTYLFLNKQCATQTVNLNPEQGWVVLLKFCHIDTFCRRFSSM